MPVESATYLHELNSANPAASDTIAEGDNHLRLIKAAVKATFPNFDGAVQATNTEIDDTVDTVAGGNLKFADGTVSAPSLAFTDDTNTGIYSPSADTLAIATGGSQRAVFSSAGLVVPQGIAVTGAYSGGTGQLVQTGATMIWWTNTLPTGYLWANGAAVSRTTFADLFAVLGTSIGPGNGSTTFDLPDLRDNVPVGRATMGGVSDAGRISTYATTTVGAQIGEDAHNLTIAELPAHTHTGSSLNVSSEGAHTHNIPARSIPNDFTSSEVITALSRGFSSGTTAVTFTAMASDGAHTHNISGSTGSVGSGTDFNVVQPGIVCNWIIKT